MDCVLDARSAVLIGTSLQRSHHLPDTPVRAPGAQFVGISVIDGRLVADIEEVIELDYPHRAVSVNLTVPGSITVVYTCVPDDQGGTTYTQEVTMDVARISRANVQASFEAETVRSVARLKEVLENGEWPPEAD